MKLVNYTNLINTFNETFTCHNNKNDGDQMNCPIILHPDESFYIRPYFGSEFVLFCNKDYLTRFPQSDAI